MRTAITLAWPHGKKEPKLLFGTETPIADQIAAFKQIDAPVNGEFERVEVWESSSGAIKTHKLIHPDEDKRRKKVFDSQIEAAKKAEAEAKKQADKSDDSKKSDDEAAKKAEKKK